MSYQPKTPRLVSWWKAETPEQLCKEVFDTICYLEKEQSGRRDKNLQSLRLYGNYDFTGIGPYQYNRAQSLSLPDNRVKVNIISSMCDTVSAKISKMKPRVTFLTSGGNFHTQEKAKKLNKFNVGMFTNNNVYVLHQQMFKDSLIFDIGALKHYRVGGRIISERVLPTEIYCDSADALYGKPSHLYHVKYVHKDVLAEEYPDHKAAILDSASSLETSAYAQPMQDEERQYVVVIEAWRLPSSPDAKDGRHVICVEKTTIVDEPYKRTYFPFTFERWTPAIVGFYGQSLTERLTGNQVEINKMLRIIQRSFHLGSAFKVFLEYGSKIAREHISNEVGSVVYYTGAKPEYYVPKTVHEEYFRHLEWLIRTSYEEAGISQLSAASKIPTGLDGGSGKALREYNDLETERFVLTAQEYEASFLQTTRNYIDLAREMHEDGEDFAVKAEAKRFLEEIKWSDIDLEDDAFTMQMFPTSMLPHTPSGRLAYVQELLEAGFVDRPWALSLLEFPDIEGYTALQTAPLDDLMDTLDRMLSKGEYHSPEPFQDLAFGVKLFQQAYLKAKKDNAPEENLDLVRRWIVTAQKMLDTAAAAQSVQTGAAMPAPMTSEGGAPATPQAAAGAAPMVA